MFTFFCFFLSVLIYFLTNETDNDRKDEHCKIDAFMQKCQAVNDYYKDHNVQCGWPYSFEYPLSDGICVASSRREM